MKIYHGDRDGKEGPQPVVVVDGPRMYALPHVVWHSPDGFEWGYAGSGPADLALSILADALGERQTREQARAFDGETGCPRATRLHQRFKFEFIAGLPREADTSWEINGDKVLAWVEREASEAQTRPLELPEDA